MYADDSERVAKAGRLLPAAGGANLALTLPYDPYRVRANRRLAGRRIGITFAGRARLAREKRAHTGRVPGACRVLLDALAAMQPHLDAVVLVGEQAVYLRTEGSIRTMHLKDKNEVRAAKAELVAIVRSWCESHG